MSNDANEHVATYLNDHLAGAVAALELLERLAGAQASSSEARVLDRLRAEIAADRRELESLMSRLQVDESRSRKAIAWLTEKAAQLKLRLDDSDDSALGRLEALDILSLGIQGKRALWQALAAVARDTPELAAANYERLTRRAEEQLQIVDELRPSAARAALGGVSWTE